MADETTQERNERSLLDCTAEEVKTERPGLFEAVGKQWAEENMERLGIEADRDVRHRIDILVQENEELRSEITDIRQERQHLDNKMKVDQMILHSGLSREQATKLFHEICYEAMNSHGETRVESLIDDRRTATASNRILSREQGATNHLPVTDGKSFIAGCRK